MSLRQALVLAPLLVGGVVPAQVYAQEQKEEQEASAQLWGNVVLDFPKGDRFLLELDVQPKVQYAGDESWRNLDVTSVVEYYPNRWLDLVGEASFGRTQQSNDVSSVEVTPKLGARFHFLSNLRTMLERNLLGRVAVSDLVHFEYRNFWYSDGASSHETRLRNRIALKVALNHAELSRDNTLYWMADFEFFVPLAGDVPERFATKRRTRAGLGFRRSDRWRLEVLYIRDASRDTLDEDFDSAANIVNIKLKIIL